MIPKLSSLHPPFYEALLLYGGGQGWKEMTISLLSLLGMLLGRHLQLEFQPVNAENAARDKLHSLVQTRSVQDYVSAFRILCLQIPGMTAPVKLDMFVRGLKDTIQRDVLIQRPQTFDAAVIIAETIDAIDFRMHRKSPRLTTSSSLNITHSSGSYPSRPYAAALLLALMLLLLLPLLALLLWKLVLCNADPFPLPTGSDFAVPMGVFTAASLAIFFLTAPHAPRALLAL